MAWRLRSLLAEVPGCECSVVHPDTPESCLLGWLQFFRGTLGHAAPMYFSLHALSGLLKVDYKLLLAALRKRSDRDREGEGEYVDDGEEGEVEAELKEEAPAVQDTRGRRKRKKKAEKAQQTRQQHGRQQQHAKSRLKAVVKMLRKVLLQVAENTTRSTLFLSCAATTIIASICLLRRVWGTIYVFNLGAVPGILATWGLELEKPSRRHDFAVYTSNVAVRILFRKLQQEGVVSAIPKGERLVAFVSLLTLLTAQAQHWSHQGKLMKTILGLVANDDEGDEEAQIEVTGRKEEEEEGEEEKEKEKEQQEQQKEEEEVQQQQLEEEQHDADHRGQHRGDGLLAAWARAPIVMQAKERATAALHGWLGLKRTRHRLCRHATPSCAGSILEGMGHGAALASAAAAASVLARVVLQRNVQLSPKLLAVLLTTTPLSRLLRCLIRHRHHRSAQLLRAVVVSAWMADVFNTGLAHYLFGRAAEALLASHVTVSHIVPRGVVDRALFALAAMVIMHFAVVEPSCLPGSYFRFLDRITSGLFSRLDRVPLEPFGFNTALPASHVRGR